MVPYTERCAEGFEKLGDDMYIGILFINAAAATNNTKQTATPTMAYIHPRASNKGFLRACLLIQLEIK